MITPDRGAIPASSLKRVYYHRGIKRDYHIWPNPKGDGWIWDAAGRQEFAPTAEAAEADARRWIKDGQ